MLYLSHLYIHFRPAAGREYVKFTAALEKESAGGYSVRCVELPAVISDRETEAKALSNIGEAIELVLEEPEARAKSEKRDKLELVTATV